ncbi:uncharacterized protein ATNIH1004_003768 [Aspergillus tanneri]|uniref:Uncharacterized protein n=1 Tax=Aspergillus tanneri TaxID=1220188 RepID=A0A5M9MVG2_9EURO|nr:uncharacterized protein ATNIH1004_003768 [Aspergillus tanneri]KAA8651075.1 hypothetical protein ATNIH1004_003768 [Aspergillus tanneri]
MANQFYGAAFIYPVYLLHYTIANNSKTLTPPRNNPRMTIALLISAVTCVIMPFTFLFPAFVRCSVARRQRAIALYRFAPLVLALVQWGGEQLPLEQLVASPMSESVPYVVVGVAAAVGHLYALLGAAALGTVRQVYLPSPAPPTSPVAVLPKAAREFLQYDVHVLVAAFLPFAYHLLAPVVSI